MYNITQILKIERPKDLLHEAIVRENFSLSKKTSVVIITDNPPARLYHISKSFISEDKNYNTILVLEDFEIIQDIESNSKLAEKKKCLRY